MEQPDERREYTSLTKQEVVPWVDVDPFAEIVDHYLCPGCGNYYLLGSVFGGDVCDNCSENGVQPREKVIPTLFDLVVPVGTGEEKHMRPLSRNWNKKEAPERSCRTYENPSISSPQIFLLAHGTRVGSLSAPTPHIAGIIVSMWVDGKKSKEEIQETIRKIKAHETEKEDQAMQRSSENKVKEQKKAAEVHKPERTTTGSGCNICGSPVQYGKKICKRCIEAEMATDSEYMEFLIRKRLPPGAVLKTTVEVAKMDKDFIYFRPMPIQMAPQFIDVFSLENHCNNM